MDLKTALKKTEGVTKYSHRILGHCNAALAAMQRMKENSQMTDVVLKVDYGCIQAHRLVLASTSDYFFAMFNDDMLEKQLSEIVLRDIDVETLKLLVDYLYSGDLQITGDNVESLLSASSLLQIWPVREGCSEFLLQHLHPLNCFGVWRFADAHGLTDLKDKSLRFVRSNFHKAMDSEEFLLLSFSESWKASEIFSVIAAHSKFSLHTIRQTHPEERPKPVDDHKKKQAITENISDDYMD